jgi:hypothetical protein
VGSPASVCGPPVLDKPTWALRSSLWLGSVVPTFIAWRPHPPVCCPPLHFPALPVIGAVFGIQESSYLGNRPSGLSLLNSPGLPPSASAGRPDTCIPQFFRVGSGHRVDARNPWRLHDPAISYTRGGQFRRLVRSLSLRPSWLLVPWADPTDVPPPALDFYFRAFSPRHHCRGCRISLRRQTRNCAGGTCTR